MNYSKSPDSLHSNSSLQLQLAANKYFSEKGMQSHKEHNLLQLNPSKTSNSGQWLSISSLNEPVPEFNDDLAPEEEIIENVYVDTDPYFMNEEEDTFEGPLSSNEVKEEKLQSRKQKNAKNYKDLNNSLANLALKRIHRSSSSDRHNTSQISQPQIQTDKSFNFELQPSLFSPSAATGHKISLATTNYTNLGLNTSSYGLSPKIEYSSHLTSPSQYGKRTMKSHESPKPEKVCPKHKPYSSEQDSTKLKPVSQLSAFALESKRTKSPKQITLEREGKESQKIWTDNKINFFPGDIKRDLPSLQTKETKSFNQKNNNNKNRNEAESLFQETKHTFSDLDCSFKDTSKLKERRPILESRLPSKADPEDFIPAKLSGGMILDSSLPSKADLSGKQYLRKEVKGCEIERIESMMTNCTNERSRERSFSPDVKQSFGEVKYQPKLKINEEKLETIEQKTVHGWKQDLLKIRAEIEERQHNYQEVRDFIRMCEKDHRLQQKSAEEYDFHPYYKNNNNGYASNSVSSIGANSHSGVPTAMATPNKEKNPNIEKKNYKVCFKLNLTEDFNKPQCLTGNQIQSDRQGKGNINTSFDLSLGNTQSKTPKALKFKEKSK